MKFTTTIVPAVMGAAAAAAMTIGSPWTGASLKLRRANPGPSPSPSRASTSSPPSSPVAASRRHSLGVQQVTVDPSVSASILDSNDLTGPVGTGTPAFRSNLAGAIKTGTGLTSTSATIQIPTPKVPNKEDANKEWVASLWVGIDGIDIDCSAQLQTGIDMHVVPGNKITYEAWAGWTPDPPMRFTDFPVAAGDSITMTVSSTAADKKSGTATLVNHTQNKQASHTFSNQALALCQTSAEWMVEDTADPTTNARYPLADFGSVSFADATPDPTGASRWIMAQGNPMHLVTTCNIQGNAVNCKYNNFNT